MARPIWKGGISFGLVYIPVTLFSAEQSSTLLHFHLLDSRNNARVRYQRINEKTGKEVPWDKIVKGYEFEKDHYVIVEESEFEKTASKSSQVIDIQNFIDQSALESVYYERPYYLAPNKQGEKAYVLLREILLNTKKVGVAKVLIRTKEYLSVVMPYQNSLILNILRFPEEVRDPKEFNMPEAGIKEYKITQKELALGEQLVKTMTVKWNPKKYNDDSHEIMMQWIEAKIKKRKSVLSPLVDKKNHTNKQANLIDFMSVLKKSIVEKENKKKTRKKAS